MVYKFLQMVYKSPVPLHYLKNLLFYHLKILPLSFFMPILCNFPSALSCLLGSFIFASGAALPATGKGAS